MKMEVNIGIHVYFVQQNASCTVRSFNFSYTIIDSDGTLFVNTVLPFVVGEMRKEVVMVRVGESRCNMIEGCQEEFYKTLLVSSLTVLNDWVLDMDPFNGKFGYSA